MEWLDDAQTALTRGDHASAVTAFEHLHAALPADVSIAMALANAFALSDNATQSRETLLGAFRHGDWTDPAVAFALGSALLERGEPHAAAECISRTVKAFPNDAAAHSAFAGALRASARPTLAWTHAERALKLAPKNPTILLTAAQVRHDLHDFARALSLLDRATALRPDHAPTTLQRAFTTLIEGVGERAWTFFEARPQPTPDSNAKRWRGEPLSGGSILVTAEQGMGDQFQFSRFVGELKQLGAGRVIMECHADAVSLFAQSGYDAVARGTVVETDWHVPIMSLPYQLKTDTDTFRNRVPYLTVPNTGVAESTIPAPVATPTRKLGVVWAGNPDFLGRASRDLDPALLPQLVKIPGVEWVSLQLGDAARHTPAQMTKVDLTRSWADTASVLSALDGLVTVDTGMAHLAGALNLPTWVLVSYVSDWRWGTESRSSAWYPSVRVIRQTSPGDWNSVIEQLREEFA